jgi:hypothetical protein
MTVEVLKCDSARADVTGVGFKIGIGGKIGPFRAGISTRGAGIGAGPFSLTTGVRGRRSSGG